MAITYKVDQTNNLIRVKATGSLTDEDMRQCESLISAEERITQGCRILFDATAATVGIVPEVALKRLLGMGGPPSSDEFLGSKTAIVSPDTRCSAWIQALMRGTDRRVIVFTSLEIAELWLGLNPDHERALQPSLKDDFLSKPGPVLTT
jgi:hypothetical protein